MALQIKLSNISWDSVRMLNIEGHNLEVITQDGAFDFKFPSTEDLRQARCPF